MNHGSLFSGIGGFDFAAEWIGWTNLFHCEIEPFPQKILKHYWPDAELFTDIKKSDFTKYADKIDVLSGGFPCQPYSTAGKRLGKEDDRHLWPEMLRAIREIKPRWVVGENVSGLISWNGGLVFDEVQADLEAEGYEVIPFVLPACAVNAPHRRDRVWFVAKNTNENGRGSEQRQGQPGEREQRDAGTGDHERVQANNGEAGATADTDSGGSERLGDKSGKPSELRQGREDNEVFEPFDVTHTGSIGQQGQGASWESSNSKKGRNRKTNWFDYDNERWTRFPTQPPVCSRNDGFPCKLDGITISKWRQESIKGYGNAVVPQVVLQIFKAIEAYEHSKTNG